MENNQLSVKQLLPIAIQVFDENPIVEYCTTSWLRRRLVINFNKAFDLMKLLEDRRLIAASEEVGKYKILRKN